MSKYTSIKAYGDAEGPLGFPMRSDIASEIEQLMKDLPSDCKELGYRRTCKVPAAMDIKDGERADISLITTDTVDRDNEVMLPGGGDFKQFRKNPVVTFAHRYDELPIGRCAWLHRQKDEKQNGWLAKTEYTSQPKDWQGAWFPDAVWHMVKQKHLLAKSIGFLPLEMRAPEEKDIIDRPELAKVKRIITKWLALEYAVAPVQSNPDAIVQTIAKAKSVGLVIPEVIIEEMGLILPQIVPGLSVEPETEPIEEVVAKMPTLALDDVRKAMLSEIQKTLSEMHLNEIVENTLDKMRGRV